jgi:hypothetical protein
MNNQFSKRLTDFLIRGEEFESGVRPASQKFGPRMRGYLLDGSVLVHATVIGPRIHLSANSAEINLLLYSWICLFLAALFWDSFSRPHNPESDFVCSAN